MLHDLPNELLLLTFQNFYQWKHVTPGDPNNQELEAEGVQTLASLCLTCKNFRALSEPILYQGYSSPDRRHDGREEMQSTLYLFLRTLIHRPDLASQVRTLFVGPWETVSTILEDRRSLAGDGYNPTLNPLPQALITQYATAGYQSTPKTRPYISYEDWVSALEGHEEDGLVALLFALTPNVESLSFVLPNEDAEEHNYFFMILVEQAIEYKASHERNTALQSARPEVQIFKRLKRLKITAYQDFWLHESTDFSIMGIAELLQLPGLESLSLSSLFEAEAPGSRLCPPRSSHIQHLDIINSNVSGEVIHALTNSCITLRSFKLSWGQDMFDPEMPPSLTWDHWPTTTWPEIREALYAHRETLEELTLYIPHEKQMLDFQHDIPAHTAGEVSPMGSLAAFTSLRRLQITERGLVNMSFQITDHECVSTEDLSDKLPSSLQVLEILDCSLGCEPLISHLEDHRSLFPNLRHARLFSEIWPIPEGPFHDDRIPGGWFVGNELTWSSGDCAELRRVPMWEFPEAGG